jgi:hypothetical protein
VDGAGGGGEGGGDVGETTKFSMTASRRSHSSNAYNVASL